MNAIVMNTLTGAVTEYRNFAFQSITPNYAGSAAGLHQLGGGLDAGALVTCRLTTGKTNDGSSKMKRADSVYLSSPDTPLAGTLTVTTNEGAYSYDFASRAPGVTRAVCGRGVRSNYFQFTVENAAGADFTLDKLEASLAEANTRRI